MLRKRLILASYPLGYFGLFVFTYWVTWQHVHLTTMNNLDKVLFTLRVLFIFVLMPFMSGDSYFESLLIEFSEQVQRKSKIYFSYLDKVSLGLFITLGVSIFLGKDICSQVTEILFYFALGLYVSSSAVVLLFLSRK